MKNSTNQKIAMKVSWTSIVSNVVLFAFKLFAGIFAHSAAMVSDAVHSISDVFSTFIVMIGVKMSCKEADKKHPYGHERFECVAAVILAVILCLVGIGIGYSGLQKIMSGNYNSLILPGSIALIAAVISIVIKESMYWYTRMSAKKINSGALMADAWHHRSDALSSIGSFVGILGARLGFPIMDPLASVVICIFIVKAAVSIFMDAVGKMTDKSCDETTVEKMKSIILSEDGVISIDQIRTRLFGNKIYVEVDINANGDDSLSSTHEVAHRVHDKVEANFINVKHCMVHVSPADE